MADKIRIKLVAAGPCRSGAWLRVTLLWAFVLLCIEHLFVTCVWSVPPDLGDEGVAALDALRILAGQVPHSDYFEIIPPLSFLPSAALFSAFGVSALAMRLLTLLYGILLIVLVDRVLARFAGGLYRLASASLLAVVGVSAWRMPSHHWLADLLQVGAIYCLIRAVGEGASTRYWSLFSGALVACAGFTLQDQGIYFCLALFSFALPWMGSRKLEIGVAWFLGLCITGGTLLSALWARAPIGNMFYEWVKFPLTRYGDINPGGLLAGWRHFFGTDFFYELKSEPIFFVTSIAIHLLVALAPLVLLPIGFAWWRDKGSSILPGLLLAALAAFYGTCLHRWALTNLTWALPAALLGLGWVLRQRGDRGVALPGAIRAGLLFVLILCWANALATQRILLDPNRERIQTAVGVYCLPQKKTGEAQRIRNAVDAIRRIVPEGEPVFTRGYVPSLAFYAGRPPLSRYNFYLSGGYHTETQGQEIQSLLISRRQSYIIASKPIIPDLSFDRWLLHNAQPIWMNDLIVLFRVSAPQGKPDGVPHSSP